MARRNPVVNAPGAITPMTELSIAVTDLVRFCHRSGDIDHRFSPSPTGAEGIAGHQRIYRQRPDTYSSEYPVTYEYATPGLRLILRGRADGYDPRQGLVEEIKTCRTDPTAIPRAVAALHRAQGRLYAAVLAAQEGRDTLQVRVTWLNIDSDEVHSEVETCSGEFLAGFLQATLERFGDWLQFIARLRRARDASLAALDFPWGEFRHGQRPIAELSYKCIDQGGQVLLEAPTGIGKTAAVLFPALKALATGKHDKLVFGTAKTVGRKAAEAALQTCAAAGYTGSSLSLTAKDSICLSPGKACHGDDCPYARDYYDKLPAALSQAMGQGTLQRENVELLAREHEVCPYELAQDLVPWVDVIIGDVHYIYSLTAGLGHAMQLDGQRWSILLDEAHNLPGRARGMYSARLAKQALMDARKAVSGALKRALERCNRQFLALQKGDWQTPGAHRLDTVPASLLQALQGLTATTSEAMAADAAFLPRHPEYAQFFFDVLQFLRVADNWGDEYRFELSRGDRPQSLVLALNCLDPARLLGERHSGAHSVIAFSATLSPLPWARASLGLAEEAVCSRSDSPFAQDQLRVSLATNLDTRFRQREQSLPALAGRIAQWLGDNPGNCIVYFPSYRYMQDALALLPDMAHRRLWVQETGLSEEGREELLTLFEQRTDLAAFCILGGIFGEGIDLPGERLRSVVVVGVGMPQVNRDTRQLQDYFEARYGAGFDYTFLYPGMQKVDQAIGRVVRTLEDTGHALLIDPRYGQQPYRGLLPRWWEYEVEG